MKKCEECKQDIPDRSPYVVWRIVGRTGEGLAHFFHLICWYKTRRMGW